MNRKVIALAIASALAAPVAFADSSSVTLTGVINGSLDLFKFEGGGIPNTNKPDIGTNATRFQIDGSEDLGWSKAIFSLAVDQAFAGPNAVAGDPSGPANSGNLFNRNSYLGLTGGWGTLRWGQNEHQYEIQQIIQDPLPASENEFNALNIMTRYGFNGTGGFTARESNSIWYTSPNLSGFVVDVAYITGGGVDGGPGLDPKGYQVAGQYNLGGWLDLFAAYAKYDDFNKHQLGAPGQDTTDKAFRIGAGLMFGGARIDLSYEALKGEVIGVGEAERKNFYVSLGYKVGAGTIRAAYSKADDAEILGVDIPNSGADQWVIGYGHGLSKRTEAYAYYGSLDNEDLATFRTGLAGRDIKGLSLGVRHSF